MNATNEGLLARAALRSAAWSERWFPDAWVFAALGVVIVALAVLAFGATPTVTVNAFGDGFWSLIPFTMQMAFVVIGGYVVATAPVVARFIDLLARVGYGASKYKISPSGLDGYHVNEHGLRYGAGMQAFFDPKNGVRFDYTRVDMNDYNEAGGFFSPGDKNANVWTLSYVRRF